jgi:hypothetical protein
MIQIDIHPTGEEPGYHVVRMAPRISQPSVKSLLSQNRVSAPGMKSWLPAIVWPDRHPGLPHSPSNKPPWSREGRFDKVVTGLLDLPGPINLTCGHYKSKIVHWGQNDTVLNRHMRGGGYHLETSEYPWPSPHPSLPSDSLSPICSTWSQQHTWI